MINGLLRFHADVDVGCAVASVALGADGGGAGCAVALGAAGGAGGGGAGGGAGGGCLEARDLHSFHISIAIGIATAMM